MAWYINRADNEVQIPPLPPGSERHTCPIKIIVQNWRSTNVTIDVSVDGHEIYTGTVANNTDLMRTDLVMWVDDVGGGNHSHEVIFNFLYDGQAHLRPMTLHPTDVLSFSNTVSYLIT